MEALGVALRDEDGDGGGERGQESLEARCASLCADVKIDEAVW